MTVAQYRPDCMTRWRTIKAQIGDVAGKSLVDVGCGNAFFAEQFLESGGSKAVGVEISETWRKQCPDSVIIYNSTDDVKEHFDYCLFLDLQYHDGIDYLQWCKDHASVCFIAPSGDGSKNNQRLFDDLKKIFNSIEPTETTKWADRMIFKCR